MIHKAYKTALLKWVHCPCCPCNGKDLDDWEGFAGRHAFKCAELNDGEIFLLIIKNEWYQPPYAV